MIMIYGRQLIEVEDEKASGIFFHTARSDFDISQFRWSYTFSTLERVCLFQFGRIIEEYHRARQKA